MASSMMSSAATVSHAATSQITMMSSFSGLKSSSSFPATSKPINGVASTGVKVRCMQVRPPAGMKKFETLSYLPPLSQVSLAKEVDYLLRKGWIPCLEFELEVLKELEEAKKAYPKAFIRIIGFDNIRQVQCMSFITYKP